jgi:hypothetical protein
MIRTSSHIIIFLLISLFSYKPLFANNGEVENDIDSSKIKPDLPMVASGASATTDTDSLILKPNLPLIGLTSGALTFYGDVKKNNYYKLFKFKFGYDLSVKKQINRNFDVSAHLLYGKVFGEERSPNRNLNFISPIVNPYISAEYALNRFRKYKIRYISPYVSLGLGLVYFHPKGDLLDENGNTYYYWQDGSIKNQEETGDEDLDSNAIVIYRDYKYETDLRKANIDGFGNYPLINMTIPMGVGLNCKVTPKITVKLGTTLHYTLSDLIDNVNSKSIGDRKGKPGFDKYLFSSVTILYNLNEVPPDPEEFIFNGIDLLTLTSDDTDGDGINDFDDDCADTPPGIEVDSRGCPFDDDYDGVPNYKDKERETPFGVIVDVEGVQIKDADIEQKYLEYAGDSVKGIPKEMYTVQLGIFNDGIPKELLDKFLKIEDLKKFVLEDSSVVYFSGRYYTEQGARQGLEEIMKDSIPGAMVVKMLNGKFIPLDKPKDDKLTKQKAVQESLVRVDSLRNVQVDSIASLKEKENILEKDSLESKIEKSDSSITILSDTSITANEITEEKKKKENIEKEKSDSLIAKSKEITDTIQVKHDKDNIPGDINIDLTKDKKGKDVSINDIKNDSTKTVTAQSRDSAKNIEASKDKVSENNSDTVKTKSVISDAKEKYTIQLAEYKSSVPEEDVKKLMTIKDVKSENSNNGKTTYSVGNYNNENSALEDLKKYKKMGFTEAAIVSTDKKHDELAVTNEKFENSALDPNAMNQSKISSTVDHVAGKFAVLLGQNSKDIPQEVIDKLLSVPDILSTKINETTYYTTKLVSSLSEAQNRLTEIRKNGFDDAQLVEFKNNSIMPYKGDDEIASNINPDKKEKLNNSISDTASPDKNNNSNNEKINSGNNKNDVVISDKSNTTDKEKQNHTVNTTNKIVTEGLVFRVQLGAFINKSTSEPYLEKGITDVISFSYDGYTKYFTGTFNGYDQAKELKIKMQQKGFTDAFVTVYKDGRRIEIKEALNYGYSSVSSSKSSIDKDNNNVKPGNCQLLVSNNNNMAEINTMAVIYKVQLGSFKNRVPSELLGNIQSIAAEASENGFTRYLLGNYSNYSEAKNEESKIRNKGFPEAYVVAYKNGKRISLAEAGIIK